ncbi:MAG: HAD hydrolase-like protein [Clostridia bacterium]|nr:HAD hydrolase-like protein [Clostridia bacterium]
MEKSELERARGLEKIQNFIWDFDGTLFDTYSYTIPCFCAAVRESGGTPDEALVYELMMDKIPAAFAWYVENQHLDADSLRAAYNRIHRWDPVSQGGPFPYARELLRLICESGRRNFMFTHRMADVYTLMGYWETLDYFTDIVTLADGVAPKPSPEAVELLVSRNGLDKSKTVMVGDREMDIASGAAAGVMTCHITNGKPYRNFRCDSRVASLRAIYAVLGGKCV